jgi:hypothetical protein
VFGRSRLHFNRCQYMTPSGDAVARFKDKPHGASDLLCRWRALAAEPGEQHSQEG